MVCAQAKGLSKVVVDSDAGLDSDILAQFGNVGFHTPNGIFPQGERRTTIHTPTYTHYMTKLHVSEKTKHAHVCPRIRMRKQDILESGKHKKSCRHTHTLGLNSLGISCASS